jgi:HSP20 family protein
MRVKMQNWGPGFDRLAGRIREMMQEMRGPNYFCSHARPSWTPRMNMYETKSHIIICLEIAGVDPDEVDIRHTHGILHIEGTRGRPIIPDELANSISLDEVSVHTMEIDSGKFCRGIELPATIVPEETLASYRQGLLWIVAVKSCEDVPER